MTKKIYPILFVFLLIFIIDVFADNNLVYSLKLRYDDGSFYKEDIRLIEGSAPSRVEQLSCCYTLKVISYDNQVLYSFKSELGLTMLYAPPKEWFDEQGNQIYFPKEQTLPTEDQILFLIVPYFRNAKSIDIYGNDEYGNDAKVLLFSIDVSDYATCNFNSICDSFETEDICPEDCKKISKIIYIIAGIIVLASLVLVYLFYKRKKARSFRKKP